MSGSGQKAATRLEDAIAAVRADAAPPQAAEAAAARVRSRIEQALDAPAVEAIRGCADVQALLPALRSRALPPARALLVADHLQGCAVCRSASEEPGGRRLAVLPWRPTTLPRPSARQASRRYAWAAVLVAGLAASLVYRTWVVVPPGARASVQSVSGVLQRVGSGSLEALPPGHEIGEAEAVRTAQGSQAVLRLRDGSLVELGERALVSVSARGADTTIQLERGSIIVQAAKRRSGNLRVAAMDCTVLVTGTVFSVSGGLKGSRVSVLEGQVRVRQAGREKLLQPGEQLVTSSAMGTLPLREEIAWSRNQEQHLALLAELTALKQEWDTVPPPGLRYESRLLRRVPPNAVVFASLPNYGETLAEFHRIFEQRLQQSPLLAEWWKQADPARHGGPELATMIERLRSFASYLGEEVAFAVVDGSGPGRVVPVLLAEVRRPGLREFLEAALRTSGETGRPPEIRFLGEPVASGGQAKADVVVLLRPDLIALSPEPAALQALVRAAQGGLDQTPFGQRIAEACRDGAGLLLAADVDRIMSTAPAGARERERLRQSGMDGLQHLILERKDVGGQAQTRAEVDFSATRRGVASWLAGPGPMGSLDFVSPNAAAVAVLLAKSPSLMLEDLLAIAKAEEANALEQLAQLESKLSLRLREDLADALGSEVALALDGPLLPTPAWKALVEVYDADRLQTALQTLVSKAGEEAVRANQPVPRLEAEQLSGLTHYALHGLPLEIHYAFVEGYLVAAPSRALVLKAIQAHETGDNLGRSSSFRALFPSDRHDHVSALVYENLAAIFGTLSGAVGALAPGERQSLETLARGARPTLLCAFAEPQRIQIADRGGFLELDVTNLALPMLLRKSSWPR